jgi:hypothetical protein
MLRTRASGLVDGAILGGLRTLPGILAKRRRDAWAAPTMTSVVRSGRARWLSGDR